MSVTHFFRFVIIVVHHHLQLALFIQQTIRKVEKRLKMQQKRSKMLAENLVIAIEERFLTGRAFNLPTFHRKTFHR